METLSSSALSASTLVDGCGNNFALLALVVSGGVGYLDYVALCRSASVWNSYLTLLSFSSFRSFELPSLRIRSVSSLSASASYRLPLRKRSAVGVNSLYLVVVSLINNYPVDVAVRIPVNQLVLSAITNIQSLLNVLLVADLVAVVTLGQVRIKVEPGGVLLGQLRCVVSNGLQLQRLSSRMISPLSSLESAMEAL